MRRAVLTLVLLVATSTHAATEKVAKIGFLSFWPASMSAHLDHLRSGLQELGYADGGNIEIEAYFTGGDFGRTREIARMMVEQRVDVIVTQTGNATRIAKELTQMIPIVMAPSVNPVEAGLIDSLARPGGNVTGISGQETDIAEKWVQYLRDVRPTVRSIGFLGRAGTVAPFVPVIKSAAESVGLKLVVHLVDDLESIDGTVFEAMRRDGVEVLIVQPVFNGYQDKIVPLATQAGLPVVSGYADFAEAGALLTYGADARAVMRRVAFYVDRILKGAKPADLPVEQPTAFQLTINLRAAKLFGWTVPKSLLLQADRIIE